MGEGISNTTGVVGAATFLTGFGVDPLLLCPFERPLGILTGFAVTIGTE